MINFVENILPLLCMLAFAVGIVALQKYICFRYNKKHYGK